MSATPARSASSDGSRTRRGARAPARRARCGALDARLDELEVEMRRRLEELGADAEAERAVIEARLQELLRRLDRRAAPLQGN